MSFTSGSITVVDSSRKPRHPRVKNTKSDVSLNKATPVSQSAIEAIDKFKQSGNFNSIFVNVNRDDD